MGGTLTHDPVCIHHHNFPQNLGRPTSHPTHRHEQTIPLPLGRFAVKPVIYHCISRVVDRQLVFGDVEREHFRTIILDSEMRTTDGTEFTDHKTVALPWKLTRRVSERFSITYSSSVSSVHSVVTIFLSRIVRMMEAFSGCRVLAYCVMSNHVHLLQSLRDLRV